MLDKLFSLLAPHHCSVCNKLADGLCDDCFEELELTKSVNCVLCGARLKNRKCNTCELAGVKQQIMGKFNPALRQVLHDYKYNHKRGLAKFFIQVAVRANLRLNQSCVLVPVPTSPKHIRQRGYDHTANIVRHLAKLYHCDYKPVLVRKSNFRQVGANRQTRFAQTKAAFACPTPLLTEVEYIIFDDVITTGATMLACVNALRQAGAKKITILAIARQTLDS